MNPIEQALTDLDTSNDDHWTANGLPKVEVIKEMVGGDKQITRADIDEIAPDYTRSDRYDLSIPPEDEVEGGDDPDVPPDAEPVEGDPAGDEDREDQLALLEETIAGEQKKLAKLRADRAEADKKIQSLEASISLLERARQDMAPQMKQAEVIMAYQQSAMKQREQAVAIRARHAAQDGEVMSTVGMSALDQSMARRRQSRRTIRRSPTVLASENQQ